MRFKWKESLESATSSSSKQDEEGLSTSKKAVLVVSLLNALIKNQIDTLSQLGLGSSCIFVRRKNYSTSGQNEEAAEDDDDETCFPEDLKRLEEEELRYLFMHPEVLCRSDNLKAVLRSKALQEKVVACVIDEAHLIKEW